MKTYFYNRSAYAIKSIPVPRCFVELEKHFDKLPNLILSGKGHESVGLAENLCRRMADIELYAWYILEAKKDSKPQRGAIFIGTFLVGYFSACKSLLDAGAITLAKVYNLNLTNKQMDFSKGKFWAELENRTGMVIKKRFQRFTSLRKDIIKWRDAAIHRETPLVLLHTHGLKDGVIKVATDPEPNWQKLLESPLSIPWVDPLYFHEKWLNQLFDFCQEVCLDIRSQTLS
jgi:hypothetical protein